MGLFGALKKTWGLSGGRALIEEAAAPLVEMPCRPSGDGSILRPQSRALALEQRIMFDGAAATAADQQHQGDSTRPTEAPSAERSDTQPTPAAETTNTTAREQAAQNEPAAPTIAPQHLLVIDSRVEQAEQLQSQVGPDVKVLVVDAFQDGLAAISAALADLGQVDSIQILSHGAAGQFSLGSSLISANNVDDLAPQLQGWQAYLTADADIQLYGCNVGAGVSGQTLVNELACWTGADVGASVDATGAAASGGNWVLETTVGDVDKALVLSADVLAGFDGLLATPTVSLSSGGDDVLLGSTFTVTASFTNPSADVGYAPFIDVFIPATGKDGLGAEVDDGVTFVSATYQGQAIKTYVLTFDANGQATHPLAKDITGQPVIVYAADYGLRAGDQFVVVQLPMASIISGQPPVNVVLTFELSDLADTSLTDGAPQLTIRARGGFQFGNTSADDPTVDPSQFEGSTHAFVVNPTMVDLTLTDIVPDDQTASGPNFTRSFVVTGSTASDQQLTNVVIEQDLPKEIIVTSIVPGANGTVTSITLQDGTVITDSGVITSTLAAGAYLSHYEVTYSQLTGSVDTTVNFYVPEVDSDGVPILDPVTGAPATVNLAAPSATATWTPLDARDVPADGTVLSGSGNSQAFQVLPMVVYKQSEITTDVGSTGASPGDIVTYTLNVEMSDYFAFGRTPLDEGRLVIVDQASNGQTLVDGSGVFTFTMNGTTVTVPIVPTSRTYDPTTGLWTMELDLAQAIRDNGAALAALVGDLAFDSTVDGRTTATITYQTTIDQTYVGAGGSINEGDSIGNNATITGTVLVDRFNTGGEASDSDATTIDVPISKVDIIVATVNGDPAPANVELRPGDVVTFRISYDLQTGDFEDFTLSAYMPLPLFDVSGIAWAEGSGVGQWSYGPNHTFADQLAGPPTSVVNGNYVVFDFGDHDSPLEQGRRVEILFTMVVSDTPFGDQRTVAVIAQSNQLTSAGETLTSEDAAPISSIAEPQLSISQGVVSSNFGTITGAGANGWALPGDSGTPFTTPVTQITDVNGDISGLDGADTLRMATAIENSGGGGAYDVVTTVNLPAGLSFVGGSLSSTLRIFRGDGTQLVAGVDYSVSGNVVTFLDPTPGVASLLPGRAGTAADTSGQNVVVLLYDVAVASNIAADSTLQSEGVLNNYASVNDGQDFTPVDLTDISAQQMAAPTITKVFADGTLDASDTSSSGTTGSDVVVGETILYDIVVTLPEGTTNNLRIDDLIPAGLALDMSFGGGQGYQLITVAGAGGSGALASDFNGTVNIVSIGAVGVIGTDGVDARMTFSANATSADNNAGNNSFVIRVRLVASNASDNQAGRVISNVAQIVYSDPDGDAAGGTAVDRTVAMTGSQPTVTLREPTLTLTQTPLNISPVGVDGGDLIEYTITITNSSGYDAYDINFLEAFPTAGNVPVALLTNVALIGSPVYAGGATNNGGADFVLGADGILRTADGANVDIVAGGSITLRVTARVTAEAVEGQSIDSTAQVQWTSLNDAVPVTAAGGERTGADGLLNQGSLNDYRVESVTKVPVASALQLSRIGGLDSTPPADGGTGGPIESVAVGEIVRYRLVSLIPEGLNNGYRLQVTLDEGLVFQNDGTIKIAIVSNGGVTSDIILNADGTLVVIGNAESQIAQPIDLDLSGDKPEATIAAGVVTTSVVDGRTVVTFLLGNIANSEADVDLEGVVIEFNTRVANVATNVAGTTLNVSAQAVTANIGARATDSISEVIVEPAFSNLVKQVTDFDSNFSASASTADVSVSFTQSGNATAYDVQLNDSFAGVTDYTLSSITINGQVLTTAQQFSDAGITNTSDSTGIHLSFDSIAAGTSVVVNYSVSVAVNAAYATTDAVLTWSSLPETFTAWGGTTVGADATADGERDGSGGVNDYRLAEGAGLGLITGTLWDDTQSATTSLTPDGPLLAEQAVTLRWAGADGILDTGDDRVFSTVTDSNGYFHFSALAAGNYRVEAPTVISQTDPIGQMRARIDADGSTLGQVLSTVGEGSTNGANVGYVQINDAPVNTVPGQQDGLEDVVLNLDAITVGDVDIDNGPTAGVLDVTLAVTRGVLNFSGTAPAGLTVTGAGTATMTLSGNVADLNDLLARLTYLGNANFNGNDTLTMTTRDRGNFGDADNDGIPGEAVDDQLQDVDTVAIVLAPVNDIPNGVNDVAIAVEAGGTFNTTPGVDPSGNLLVNDTDVDIATNGDVLHLTGVANAATGSSVVIANNDNSSTEHAIVGQYGTLYVRANGAARYVVDNDDPQVQALLLSSQTLTEVFTYTLADSANAAAPNTPTVTITIRGANDTPVAEDDAGTAVEAGGTNNGTLGSNATGNVLVADGNGSVTDTDVDSAANGEGRTVTGVRNVPEGEAGPLSLVSPTAIITGLYGTLTISADGSYTYVVDNANATVQALSAGQTLQDVFSYQITDVGGLSDLANLTITIQGADDAPVATDDVAIAVEAGGVANGTAGSDGTGNVLTNDSDIDNLAAALSVSAVRTGQESGTGTAGTVGTALVGAYGTLTLNADGSYTYVVDNANAAVQALRLSGNTLVDYFTYTVSDGTLVDTAQLTVTIQGANDNPVAANDAGTAVEAGGVANGTPGSNATGNVLSNDTDVDLNGETKAVQGYVIDGTATAGVVGSASATQYGTLTLNADGSYTYVVDNANATVQALLPGQTLTETFTYTVVDALGATDVAVLTITVQGADDAPVATDDTAIAVEAGGVANGTAGSDGTGNVLTNDSDIDNLAAALSVSAVRTGQESGTGTAGTVGTALVGAYGTLTLNADGSYTYVVDNANAAVQALRLSGNTLVDYFTYTVSDGTLVDTAQLTVTIQGANDNPVATDDAGTAVEAGGTNNGTAGSNATGNVLSNDTDVDLNGETKAVQGYVIDGTATAGVVGSASATQYGTLTLNADGSYTYVVDNANATVQALLPGQTLTETFTYTVVDALGATDVAVLTITVQGADDAPVATDDTAIAVEAGGVANGAAGSDGTGNVLTNDSDIDNLAAALSVSAVRTGQESGTGTAGTVGTALVGAYGTLTLNADGSYTYVVDNANAAVQALRLSGNTLVDYFTYTVSDGTLVDTAQLTVTIQGANDNPVAANDAGTAVEAGGVANGTPGSNATGNVLSNDTDVDLNGETKRVSAFDLPATGAGTVGTRFTAQYGWLTLNADGTFTYEVDNANATVQALLPGQTLTETFNYTVADALNATSTAQLVITIQGTDDTPVAVDDTATAMESGGTANATPGINPSGNLLTNDTDVDNLDPRRLDGIRVGSEAAGGAFATVGVGQAVSIVGSFGTLTVRADGSYTYVVDNAAVAVERMRGGNQDSLTDTFSYRAVDLAGQFDIAQLVVTIDGAWDAPVGVDDSGIAAAGTIRNPTSGVDAVGNVLPNDTDVDVPDGKVVSGIGVGAEATNPTLTSVAGTTVDIVGLYGTLSINADGSYVYRVDTGNLTVQNLQPGQHLDEYFTYEVRDNGNLTDRAQLYIEVFGIDNPPFTSPDYGVAVEAGGIDNGTPGTNPSGNVLDNDIDLDGDEMTIVGIRTGTLLRVDSTGTVGQVLRGRYGDLIIFADGTWSYTLDNSLPEVQALRISGQNLLDSFTYVVADPLGEIDNGLLEVVIDGRNDTPIARNDAAVAVEAGGIYNGTPGSDGTGNVLDNDSDVDGTQYGETKQVQGYASQTGATGDAGSAVAGLYGTLVINADGSFRYVVDNDNPAVQAMRTNGEVLTESFSYVMRDTAGATSQANLFIVVRGANDNPVARDDSNVASDQVVAPQASGNVLPNDSDVDGGDALQVAAIRTGAEAGSGTAGTLGQPLAGRYGTLVINADGSYTYAIDMTNPEVLAAAGFGQILQDVFTYTLVDRAGATDLAQLVIHLDISAPRVDGGSPDYFGRLQLFPQQPTTTLSVEPGLFVQPVVRQSAIQQYADRVAADGTEIGLVIDRSLLDPPASVTYGLGSTEGEYVGEVVRNNTLLAQLEMARFLGRHGRVALTADGLLADPSLFGQTPESLTRGPSQRLVPDGEAGGQRTPLAKVAPAVQPAEDAFAGAPLRVDVLDATVADAPEGTAAESNALSASAFSDQLKLAASRLYSHLVQ